MKSLSFVNNENSYLIAICAPMMNINTMKFISVKYLFLLFFFNEPVFENNSENKKFLFENFSMIKRREMDSDKRQF